MDPDSNQFQIAVSILFVTYVVSVALTQCLLTSTNRVLDIRNSSKRSVHQTLTLHADFTSSQTSF